jgi:hypothetical protein
VETVSSFILCLCRPSLLQCVLLSHCPRNSHPATRHTRRTERVGRLRKPPAWNLPLTVTPGRRYPVFRRPPFPPARMATAHWAARDHPHLDLVHASRRTLPIIATTTINLQPPIRYAWPRPVYQACFDSFASSSFFFLAPTATTSATTSSHLWVVSSTSRLRILVAS